MTGSAPLVRVEFYGLARLQAGVTGFLVEAATVGEALVAVEATCPALKVVRDGWLSPYYLVSVGGGSFTADLRAPCRAGDTLIIVGADAGG